MKRKGDYQSDTILSEDNDFITLITESLSTYISYPVNARTSLERLQFRDFSEKEEKEVLHP